MKDERYFEITPWEKAITVISSSEGFSSIVEISVQLMCCYSELEERISLWEGRLCNVLQNEKASNTIESQGGCSILKKYENNAIVRIFVDYTGSDSSENFEIVTKAALYAWKPDSHPQAHISVNDNNYICMQDFSCELEVL